MKNNFRTYCQCCNRLIKGNETKYYLECKNFSPKMEWGYCGIIYSKSLCKCCLEQIKLFIKKGGVLK